MKEIDLSSLRFEPKGRHIERLYTRDEFADLLLRAARECRSYAVDTYCTEPVPDGILFFAGLEHSGININLPDPMFRVPAECLMRAEAMAHILVREDGYHLSDIHISPLGITNLATVFHIHWSIYGWTNGVLLDHPLFPHPPFILTGPAIPLGHPVTTPFTRIRLPRIESTVIPPPN